MATKLICTFIYQIITMRAARDVRVRSDNQNISLKSFKEGRLVRGILM